MIFLKCLSLILLGIVEIAFIAISFEKDIKEKETKTSIVGFILIAFPILYILLN